MTDNTALSARRACLRGLDATIKAATRERDRYQNIVDINQKNIDKAVVEINSINVAIELLEAADDYSLMTTNQATEES